MVRFNMTERNMLKVGGCLLYKNYRHKEARPKSGLSYPVKVKGVL